MATYGQRQTRRAEAPRTKWRLAQTRLYAEEFERLDRAAETLNMSVGGYLRELVLRDELDDTGRPVWAPPEDPAPLEDSAPLDRAS